MAIIKVFRKIALERHTKNVSRKNLKRIKRRLESEEFVRKKRSKLIFLKKQKERLEILLGGKITYREVLNQFLPTNLKYLIFNPKSAFYFDKLPRSFKSLPLNVKRARKTLLVPSRFSLVDDSSVAYDFIAQVIDEVLFGNYETIVFSYEKCNDLNLGAQVVLDILIRELIQFVDICADHPILRKEFKFVDKSFGLIDTNSTPEHIRKVLYSIGSIALHANKTFYFNDIVPYPLCSHIRNGKFNYIKAIEQKELDVTNLVDYVQNSLARVNRRLTSEKLDDLCKIIGEVLINAEEHSTTQSRFSIGYFQEITDNDNHYGLFRLVILNFGQTIYEKFSDPECPNQEIVSKMRNLSHNYTSANWFSDNKFDEGTLWTLYAIQDGVTSIKDKKRGHGSIQFIDSFFSLKGENEPNDIKSRMMILSGNTQIIFDGTYQIIEKEINGDNFKFMTFNMEGEIEKKPDNNYVRYIEDYFPGTLISATIFFDEEDLIDVTN